MKKIFLFASAAALFGSTAALAQTKTKTVNPDGSETKVKTEKGTTKVKTEKGGKETKQIIKAAPGFNRTEGGLEYKIVRDEAGTNTPKIGDQVEMHIVTRIKDSVIFDSRTMNNNQPVPFQIMAPSFKGDLVEGFMMLTPGDSAMFRVPVDSLKKGGQQLPPWMEKADVIEYEVSLVSVKSQELLKKETEEKSAKQIGIDESLLQDYFKKNNLNPQKTASGLYYIITTPGSGNNPKAGDQITVNYTGKTLDGTPFDSNVDPKFNHVQPFSFSVGQRQVIAGWDEGLMLMKKGSKGTLFIPSRLAYGERGAGGAIAPNAVLVFDVEVTDIGGGQAAPAHGAGDGHDH